MCNSNSIITDVSNRIVLIKDDMNLYNCSQQLWTLNLQNKSALGVLLWNQDLTDFISAVEGDNNLADPTIPTRIISYSDGDTLSINLINSATVEARFGCFNDSTATVLCVKDNSPGTAWDVIDGDYQKLSDNDINGHPVWQKTLFQGWGNTKYLFLLPDNEFGWKWVISQSFFSLSSFSQIQNNVYIADAYCNILNSSVSDPALCNDWYLYNNNRIWTKVDYISVTDSLCDPLNNELFCIESTPFDPLPYQNIVGTYYQVHEGYPEWYKINANPNVTNSIIIFDCIYDGNNCIAVGWIVIPVPARRDIDAFCLFGSLAQWSAVEDKASEILKIDECNLWYIWVDGQPRFDLSIDIDNKQCGNPDHDINNGGIFPQRICFKDDNQYSGVQRFYGEWTKTSIIVDERPVYQFDSSPEYYLFHSYVSDTFQITKNLSIIPYDIVGQCWNVNNNPASPLNCTNGFQVDGLVSTNSYFIDSTNSNDTCFPKLSDNYTIISDTICIRIDAQIVPLQRSNAVDLSGDYIKQNGLINGRDYYFRNGTNEDYYLYYNNFYRFWIIDISINLDYQLIGIDMPIFCIEYNKLNPAECNEWYTSDVGFQFILLSTGINVRDKACITESPTLSPTLATTEPTLITVVPTILTSEPTILTSEPTILTPEPTTETILPTGITIEPSIKGSDGGSANVDKDNTIKGWVVAVIIIVIIILLAIIVCCLCKRNNQNGSAFGFDHPSSSNANTSIDMGTQINMTSNESNNIDKNATNPAGNDEANTFMETNDNQSPNAGKDGNQWETF